MRNNIILMVIVVAIIAVVISAGYTLGQEAIAEVQGIMERAQEARSIASSR